MDGGFEFAVWLEVGIGTTAEHAVGKRAAQALVEENEDHGDLDSLVGETVGVASAVAFEQCVGAQLAQVVAQLVEPIAFVIQAEAGEDDLMELLGSPAADRGAGMQQHLQQANHAGVVDLDAGVLGGANYDGQRQPLQEREVHMRVQAAW